MLIEIYLGLSLGISILALILAIFSIAFNYEDNKTLTLQGKLIIWLVKRQPSSTKSDFINKIIKLLQERK